ncbi:MAG: putative membrane protein [Phenylobacterium sp.]|jgi:putative membrane protein
MVNSVDNKPERKMAVEPDNQSKDKYLRHIFMKLLANIFTFFVAISHVGILVLEMFFWNHPIGQKIFSMSPELAASSAVLAMNQGLYNGFLAAGLFWGLFAKRVDIKIFFLACVIVAGIFGGITAKTSIIFTQGLPALIALALVLVSSRKTVD